MTSETTDAPPARGITVQYRVFLGIGGFLFITGVAYWFLSYEGAGTIMLLLAGVLGFIVGVWLWLQSRKLVAPAADPTGPHTEPAEWLPHASIWPFWIGLGAAFATGGLAMSPWLMVPGVFVLLIGVVGWARQSRYRA
jgi:Cytochrome c oxidase subunit IV